MDRVVEIRLGLRKRGRGEAQRGAYHTATIRSDPRHVT